MILASFTMRRWTSEVCHEFIDLEQCSCSLFALVINCVNITKPMSQAKDMPFISDAHPMKAHNQN